MKNEESIEQKKGLCNPSSCNPPSGDNLILDGGCGIFDYNPFGMTFSPLISTMHLSEPQLEGLIRKDKP